MLQSLQIQFFFQILAVRMWNLPGRQFSQFSINWTKLALLAKVHSREISKTFVTRSHIFAFELSRLPLFMADHCYSSCQKTIVNQNNLNTTSYNCHSGCRKTLFDQNNQNDRQNSNAIKRDLVRKSLLSSKNWTLASFSSTTLKYHSFKLSCTSLHHFYQ